MTDAKAPEFQDDRRRDKRTLCCPDCGGVWLHQQKVEVFSRCHEDASNGLHTEVGGHSAGAGGAGEDELVAVKRSSLDGNPSRRRSGIKIHFYCEQCTPQGETVGVLCISQHKGNEFMYWEQE